MKRKIKKILCGVLIMMLIGGMAGCATEPAEESTAPASDLSDGAVTTATSAAESTADDAKSTTAVSVVQTTADTAGTKPAQTTATVKKSAGTTTKRTTKPTAATTVRRQPLASDKKTSSVGSGFYCVNFDKYGFDTKWQELAKSDYVNTVFCDSLKFLRDLTDYNCRVWVSAHDIYDKVAAGTAGWQESFDNKYAAIRDSGYEKTVLGWYLDEPSNMAAVKELTRYAQKFGKRFFICFTVQATDYTVYGGYVDNNSHISKDNVQYLTDIAVDHYWEITESNKKGYEKLYGTLHKMMPENCRVWYIPNTFAGWTLVDKSDAEIAKAAEIRIEHIRYMYEWLKKEPEKNRGGLMFFSYDFNSSAEELYGLWNINSLTKGKWNNVLEECIRVGREICTDKM